MPSLDCPKCKQRLNVRPDAPPWVSCPRCLAAVRNPAGGKQGPLPVLPLDYQAEHDTRFVSGGLFVLTVFLLAGATTMLILGGISSFVMNLLGVLIVMAFMIHTSRQAKTTGPLAPPPLPVEGGSSVLDYYSPPQRSWRPWLQALGGLGVGTAFSAVVWILGWEPLVERGTGVILYIVPGMKLLAGIVFAFIPGWRQFGAGLLASLGFGFLIFFGTCAAHCNIG